jgi:RNA polymerase-binding protein DksA
MGWRAISERVVSDRFDDLQRRIGAGGQCSAVVHRPKEKSTMKRQVLSHMSTTKSRVRNRKYQGFESVLLAKRAELSSRLNDRLGDVSVDREPDDEAAFATHSFAKDLAIATLERERQTIAEIDAALQRMKSGQYGICEFCADEIPDARLNALPWARLCVPCAEKIAAAPVSSAA